MTEDSKPYHHGDLRRSLIETALDMLDDDDGWEFTLRELARRAGVSHNAPYKHFADKAALLAELASVGFERLDAALRSARSPEKSIQEEFRARCLAYVGFGVAHPNLYRLMFSPDARAAKDPRLEGKSRGSFEDLADLMMRGQTAGWLRPQDPLEQAMACWTQLHGLTLLSADGLLADKWPTLDAASAALKGLLMGLETPEASERRS